MIGDPKYTIRAGRICTAATGEPIPAGEPVLIVRAQDVHALDMIWHYYRMIESASVKASIFERIKAFDKYARDNQSRMKQPS
jgi:hypothetical protein